MPFFAIECKLIQIPVTIIIIIIIGHCPLHSGDSDVTI